MKSPGFSSRFPLLAGVILGVGPLPRTVAQTTDVEYQHRRAMEEAGASREPGLTTVPAAPNLPQAVFFPPSPPVYGASIPEPPRVFRRLNGRDLSAPEDLADFVGEIFYPPLGLRLFERSLGKNLENRLNAYRANRSALLDELMVELLRLQNEAVPARETALRTLANKQAPALAALEAEAERLRRDLIKGGFWATKAEWNPDRAWKLGQGAVANPPTSHEAEFQVVRAAAFYHDGFSIEQRGLLRELAIDLGLKLRSARGRSQPDIDDPRAVFFSPETARLRLPSPLPPELFTKIGQFSSEKAALKRELLETLVDCDRLNESRRAARVAALQVVQTPRIVALEEKADEIRRQLAIRAEEPPPWVPMIPPELRTRIDRYNQDRNGLSAEFTAAVQKAERQAGSTAPMLSQPPETRQLLLREAVRRRAEALREASREFETRHAERIDHLRVRYEKIRDELTDVARDLKDPRSGQQMTLETLLDAYRVAMQRFDAIGREVAMYERYKRAMLEPGLSPGQRRLLFRAAHASLAQGMPAGEVILGRATEPRPSF